MRPFARAALAAAASVALSGCDLALAGPFMPPILPGIGFPLTGVVRDGETHLPVGGATVLSGLGSTLTDANGNFSLYGGLASHEVSVSRAGYVGVTDGDVDPNSFGLTLEYTLDPLYREASSLDVRFVELAGAATAGLDASKPAQVFFGGKTATVSAGLYDLLFKAGVPGKIYSSVLAWGNVTAPYNPDATVIVPFTYTNFYYVAGDWPMADTVPLGKKAFPLPAAQAAPFKTTSVSYKNVGSYSGVQTVVLLDFGLLGSVPVAVANGSSQQLNVPSINGLKYDVIGTATDQTGNVTSTVTLTTNNPATASFPLLTAPKILSPANGAAGVGQRPTFSWSSAGDGVTYRVTLQEQDPPAPGMTSTTSVKKWVASTSQTEIQYPGFSQGDINGGALRSDKTYAWTLDVVDVLGSTDTPSAVKADPTRPYRVRERTARVTGNGFKL